MQKIVLLVKRDIYILTEKQLYDLLKGYIDDVPCKVLFCDISLTYTLSNAILTKDFIQNTSYKTLALKDYLSQENSKINLLNFCFNI